MATHKMNATTGLTTKVSVLAIAGNALPYEFHTMPGNQPNKNGNTVFLWQTSTNAIPSNPPQNSAAVPENRPDGSDSIKVQVTTDAYLLGYATGGDIKNCCATAFLPASGGGDPVSTTPSVTTWVIGSSSVSFNYALPGGTRPQSDGDWAGLWQGQGESGLYTVPPTWFVPIGQNDPVSNGAFTNVSVLRGTQYTIGYFKGGYDKTQPKQSTLACSVTFWS
jgi:hypothetical protein